MKLYLYSMYDLTIFERMLTRDKVQALLNKQPEEASSIDFKLSKIEQEKRRRLSDVEYIAADDPSETEEYEPEANETKN